MPSKKELTIGAAVVVIFAWALIDMVMGVVRNEQYLPSAASGTTSTIIGLAATLYAVGFVGFAAWGIGKAFGQFEEWNKRFTLKATIPGYFLLALMPVAAGLVVVVVARQTAWGIWLSCFSLPATVMLLVLTIRKGSGS